MRAAMLRYMTEHGLRPTRWALDAGLSERTVSHFLSGRSKTLSPGSLAKLAKARETSVKRMLGFVPVYMDVNGGVSEEAEAPQGQVIELAEMFTRLAEANREMTRAMGDLMEEVKSLREEMRSGAGRRKKDP